MLEFWSSLGENEFPLLARLTRFLLAASGACAPLRLSLPSSPFETNDLSTFLILRCCIFVCSFFLKIDSLNFRPEVLNSLTRFPSFDFTTQHQQQQTIAHKSENHSQQQHRHIGALFLQRF